MARSGDGEAESLLKMWRQILQAWREHGRAGKPRRVGATYFALGSEAAEHASAYILANYGYNAELAARVA